jgi:hypothetical protein
MFSLKYIKGIASLHGLELEMQRDIHLPPGDFWPEAIDCVRRACGDKGIARMALATVRKSGAIRATAWKERWR